jgi:hypothetical protein
LALLVLLVLLLVVVVKVPYLWEAVCLQLLLVAFVADIARKALLVVLVLLPTVAWVVDGPVLLLLLGLVVCGDGLRVQRLTLSRCGACVRYSKLFSCTSRELVRHASHVCYAGLATAQTVL